MYKHFPTLSDKPDIAPILGGILSAMLLYFSLPFLLLLLTVGSFHNWGVQSTLETVYHGIGFCVACGLFFGWLKLSAFNLTIAPKQTLRVCVIGLGFMAVYVLSAHIIYTVSGSHYAYMAMNLALPVTDTESHMTLSVLLSKNAALGLLCGVVFIPVTVSCLFYSVAFAPVCYRHPWLGYVVLAIYLLAIRMGVGATRWNFQQEFELYLFQLPIHLIACWTYQKTDTVWAPIITLMAANGISCILILILL